MVGRRIILMVLVSASLGGATAALGQQGSYGEVHLKDGRTITGLIKRSDDVVRITTEGGVEEVKSSQVEKIRLGGGKDGGKISPDGAGSGAGDDDSVVEIPVNEAVEKALLEEAGSGFSIKRTDHFIVAYDVAEKTLAELVSRLEATYSSVYRLCKINELPARRPKGRMEVFFFDDYEDFGRYATRMGFAFQGMNGFYYEKTNRSAFFNADHDPQMLKLQLSLAAARGNMTALQGAAGSAVPDSRRVPVRFPDGKEITITKSDAKLRIAKSREEVMLLENRMNKHVERINMMVVQHEAAHQILFNAGVHVIGGMNPMWLAEGLACLFETPPSKRGAGVGALNQWRLYDFRNAVGNGRSRGRLPARGFLASVDRGQMVHLGQMLTDRGLFAARDDSLGYRYAESWALVYYLQRQKADQFADYIRRVSSRRPGQGISPEQELADFEASFGRADGNFAKAWVTWILKQPFRPVEAGL